MKSQQYLLCYLNAIASMGFSIIAPLFPPMCKEKGISNQICSCIIAIIALPEILMTMYCPSVLKRFGRKNTFLFSLIVQSLCTLFYGLMNYIGEDQKFFFVSVGLINRLIHGFCSSTVNILCFSITASINEGPELQIASGLMELSWMIGLTLGPVIVSITYPIHGYILSFGVSSLITSTGIIIFFYIPEINDSVNISEKKSQKISQISSELKPEMRDKPDNEKLKMFLPLFKYPQILLLTGSIMIQVNTTNFYIPTLVNYLYDEYRIDTSKASLFFLSSTIGYTLTIKAVPWVTERIGNFCTLTLSHFSAIIGCLLTGPTEILPKNYFIMIIGIFLQGINSCFINICSFIELNNFTQYLFPDNEDAKNDSSAAFYNFSFYLGNLFSPLLGSYVTVHYGFRKSADVSGLISLIFDIFFTKFYLGMITLFFKTKKELNQKIQDQKKSSLIQMNEL